jgi:transcriptional regulator with XRE-family HTH domain
MELQKVKLDPNKLRDLRGERSQTDVGTAIGVTGGQISNIENGAKKPSAEGLLRLMLLYDICPKDIALDS